MKRFLKWIGLKEKLDSIQIKPPFFKEGEIWWCRIGENIGVEINGKRSDRKSNYPIQTLALIKMDLPPFLAGVVGKPQIYRSKSL